jgi:hypothetical protein
MSRRQPGAQPLTSLYLLEIPAFEGLRVNIANTPLAVLGDNVVVVQQYEIDGALRRLLAVLRMRLSFFDCTLRELVMDEQEVQVLKPEERVLEVLKTGAQVSGVLNRVFHDAGIAWDVSITNTAGDARRFARAAVDAVSMWWRPMVAMEPCWFLSFLLHLATGRWSR